MIPATKPDPTCAQLDPIALSPRTRGGDGVDERRRSWKTGESFHGYPLVMSNIAVENGDL